MEREKISLSLELTREEVNEFFHIAYGASLVPFINAPGASAAYKQIMDQIESYLIKTAPENERLLRFVKEQISDAIKPKHDAQSDVL